MSFLVPEKKSADAHWKAQAHVKKTWEIFFVKQFNGPNTDCAAKHI